MQMQELFDKMVEGLNKQKAISTRPATWDEDVLMCAYRAENGNRCAVGMLIPDDLYVPELEGRPAASSEIFDVLGIDYDQEFEFKCFLNDAQTMLHDNFQEQGWSQIEWEENVHLCAQRFKLVNPLTKENTNADT